MHNKRSIFVCQGTGCLSAGSDAVYKALKAELAQQGIKDMDNLSRKDISKNLHVKTLNGPGL